MPSQSVLVIGGGLAGLASAVALAEAGVEVQLCEKRPHLGGRATSYTLPDGTEMVMPGDNTAMTVELQKPIAMDEGLRFAIREGGRTVGSGVVVSITE